MKEYFTETEKARITNKAKEILNMPLSYKRMTEHLGLSTKLGGTQKATQLRHLEGLVKFTKTKKPTRYIITEVYKKPKTIRSNNCNLKLRDNFLNFCERRHIKPAYEVPEIIAQNDKMDFICDCHPNKIQHSTVRNIMNSVGCPLCTYPMSRTEVMIFLGIKDAKHRVKINGVEYDIFLPKEKIVVEFDGLLYHKDDEETGRTEKKLCNAKENGLRLIKIIENKKDTEPRIEGDNIYVPPYHEVRKEKRVEIANCIQQLLPFEYSDLLWDKAADYMRDWKYNKYKLNDITSNSNHPIHQYDSNGNLIAEYKNFDEIKDAIAKGQAFGYKWEVL